jgi:ATP-dependent helicase HrpA
MDPYKRLEILLPRVMSPDRHSLAKELKFLSHKSRKNKSSGKDTEKLFKLERKINNSIRRKEWRRKNIPEFSFNPDLPITSKKEEIIEAIRNNNVVIVSGETGSGKTTQLPKFCLAAGRGINGIIGCTQPRRIAATSIANRIANELGEEIGKSVGYKIRFDEKAGENLFIKIMTDGILLAETAGDPFLNAYDTIIVDEAHERSINIDFILGILKKLLARRRDLKVIITSATIDTDKFSKAFSNAPVIEVSGKMYPVEVLYMGASSESSGDNPADYTEQAAEAALDLLKESPSAGCKEISCLHPALGHPCPSDILIFMPTEQDIRETFELLEKKNRNNFIVLPLYARLPAAQQREIFNPASKIKIIVSTNIAETSLTIPNIGCVIDTGLARISEYSPSSGIVSMPVKAISRSSADQRMGRCGRVREGICIRLYDKEDYEGRDKFTKPEIFRTNLAEVILKMTAFGLGDVSAFPFIDKPKQQAITDGINTLAELGAIQKVDINISLTERGRIMAALPVDPRLSRMLLEANERKCLSEVLAIASMLSVQDPKERPVGKESKSDGKHETFIHRSSDFLTLLNIWNKFNELYNTTSSRNKIRKFCRENFISYNRMKDIREIHAQLSLMLEENGIAVKKVKTRRIIKEFDPLYTAIHKSILTGFISNIANKKSNNLFAASKQREAMIFPGSGIFGKAKDWIVCAELVKTSQLFARTAANIKPEWLEELAGSQCEYSYRDAYWDREKSDVYAYEQVALFGLEIIKNRRILYGRKNPLDASKVFIREALVGDTFTEIGVESTAFAGSTAELFQLGRSFDFLHHNAELIKKFLNIENRIRRKILIGRDDLYMFYADHIHDIYNANTLDNFIKKNRSDEFLRLKDDDLLASVPDYEKLQEYPEKIIIDDTSLDLVYKFSPESENDGITVRIPVAKIQSVNINLIEPAIPGFYKEKIAELIKNLPKQYRRHFVPASEAVDSIAREMPKGSPLIASIQKFIHNKYNVEIPKEAWQTEALPDYLKLKLSIMDKNGKEIKSGRDPEVLIKKTIEDYASDAIKRIKKEWEKQDIREWDFNDMPASVEIKNELGMKFLFYPALALENRMLNLRIFQSKEKALSSHKAGVAKLAADELFAHANIIKNTLEISDELKNTIMFFGGTASIRNLYYERIIRDNFYKDIRTKQDFYENIKIFKDIMYKTGSRISVLLSDVLENYRMTMEKFEILKQQNKAIKQNMEFLNKLKDELNSLVPCNFLLVYEDEELSLLGRYIKVFSIRAERGCTNVQKDIQKEREILYFKDALDLEYGNLRPDVSAEKKKALRDFFWLIEEYKVSVFAPEIKSAMKISAKKLEEALEEIRRMS